MTLGGRVVNVSDHTYGSELDGDHAAGATSLTVIWTNDFAPDGGTLVMLDDTDTVAETIAYTVPPDATTGLVSETQIDLATPLANSYTSGDRVLVSPTKVERWAWFKQPDAEEPIPARVPHNLVPLLPEGARTGGEGEQIDCVTDDQDVVVFDVLGKSPVTDLNSTVLTTNPDGTGERIEIKDDGLTEYEDDDTPAVTLTQAEGLDLAGDTSLGTRITRMIRWLVSGDVIAYVAGFETGTSDAITVSATARTSGGTATASLAAVNPIDLKAMDLVVQAADTTASQRLYAFASPGPTVTILTGDGTSDFEFDTSDGWQNWTPTLTGWSANPTNAVYRYKQIGKLVVCSIRQGTAGTSNATTKAITAPVPAATITNMIWAETCAAVDNGANLSTSSQVSIASGSSSIQFAKDLSTLTGGWTASGGHAIKYCTLIYEA